MKRDRHYTSWAATLATAAELARRCYDATITFGNTPKVDLLAGTKEGPAFKVQVKGIGKKENGVWIQKSFFDMPTQQNLFLFIVVVPDQDKKESFQFFIMTHKESQKAYASIRTVKRDGTPYKPGHDGLYQRDYENHKDRWDKLPGGMSDGKP